MTNENGSRESLSKYEQWVFILNVLSIIVSTTLTGFNLYLVSQILETRRANLEFQNIMYNFTSVIVAEADYAILDEPSEYTMQDGNITATTHFGYLDVNLEVITPHYGTLTLRLKTLNVVESEYLSSERRNETEISYAYGRLAYEYTVVAGLNQISDQLHLVAHIYPISEKLPPQGVTVQIPLGYLFLEAELFDIQTETTLTEGFSARIFAILETLP